MKRGMLICFFISMFVGKEKKECGSYKLEIVIRKVNTKGDFFRKILNSHLFWLNSNPGRACLVLRACRSAAFLDHNAKKGCEFNQKRCEFKIFLF